ncbi:Protein N-terminal and lysine N-methyltransferase efm7 [Exophiala dermatitidis]
MDRSDEEDDPVSLDLFQEPADFYQPEKPATFTTYTLQNGQTISLRLVGHSPLWGHLLWNAGQVIAQYLEDNAQLCCGKTVLELGAGAGLPSLTAAILGAEKVVVTDYPDPDLIMNLRYNIEHCSALADKSNIVADGFLWGSPAEPLKAHIGNGGDAGFDLLILADILFNHSEHAKLLATLRDCLKKSAGSVALVFFTPYRPWLLEKDLHFFDIARADGFVVNKILERTMDKVMFENDPGDEKLRKTVFGYEVKWQTDASFTKQWSVTALDNSSITPPRTTMSFKRTMKAFCARVVQRLKDQTPVQRECYTQTVAETKAAGTPPGPPSGHKPHNPPPSAPGKNVCGSSNRKSGDVRRDGGKWVVQGVGSFDNHATYTFDQDNFPAGLLRSNYTCRQQELVGPDQIPYNIRYDQDNVQVSKGVLTLTVPGRQDPDKDPDQAVSCAEVTTAEQNILYASVRTNAIFSQVPGTCHGLFFYKSDCQEIDIEYLTDSSSLSIVGPRQANPIWYTNQAVDPKSRPATRATGPAPSDCAAQVHEYRIDWTSQYTAFYIDGNLQQRFPLNVPSQPGPWVWNNWANGDKGAYFSNLFFA